MHFAVLLYTFAICKSNSRIGQTKFETRNILTSASVLASQRAGLHP